MNGWQERAACRLHDPRWWETPPPRPDGDAKTAIADARRALRICWNDCPVRTDCHQQAPAAYPVGVILGGVAYDGQGKPCRPCRRCGRPVFGRGGAQARFCDRACAEAQWAANSAEPAEPAPVTAPPKRVKDPDVQQRQNDVYRLRRQGLTVRQIAAQLGISENMASTDLSRARKAETFDQYPTAEQRIRAAARGEPVWLANAERELLVDLLDDGTRTMAQIAVSARVRPALVSARRRLRSGKAEVAA